jgi:hypothetical protein
MMDNYSTLLDAINGLQSEGYTEDFNQKIGLLKKLQATDHLQQNEYVIDKHFRFDECSDPSNQSIIYAITSNIDGTKGILVNGYGIYSEQRSNLILERMG